MRQAGFLTALALVILVATVVCSTSQADKPAGSANSQAATSPASTEPKGPKPAANMEPRAQEALMKMSQSLAGAPSLNFCAKTTMDQWATPDQMVQVERNSRIHFVRPDRVLIETSKGKDTWTLCHCGSTLTLMDLTTKRYASSPSPHGVEAVFDELADKYGAIVPMAELLFPDPYKAMTENIQQGVYVGEHEIAGVPCTHLLFVQEDVDWQIWIASGERSVPRKIIIDYKHLPGRPRFTAMLSDWNFASPADQKLFQPSPPQDAKKVDMPALFAAERGE